MNSNQNQISFDKTNGTRRPIKNGEQITNIMALMSEYMMAATRVINFMNLVAEILFSLKTRVVLMRRIEDSLSTSSFYVLASPWEHTRYNHTNTGGVRFRVLLNVLFYCKLIIVGLLL